MGIFSRGPSLREIDDSSIHYIEERMSEALQTGRFERWQFDALLQDMRSYIKRHNLGMWKRSRLVGNLEVFLEKVATKEERLFLLNKARQDLIDKR